MYSISCPGRIALLEIPPLWLTILWGLGASRMDFPRPGKIIPCLCGRIHGFVGLDGQKAYVMNFRRPTKKLLACLDVAGLVAERLPMNFSRPEKSYGLCLATGNSSRLGVFGCAGTTPPMNFPAGWEKSFGLCLAGALALTAWMGRRRTCGIFGGP